MALFKGIATALVTPFDEKERLDFDALGRIVERQILCGVKALVACGTTGEASTLCDDEKLEVISFVVKEARGKVKVIAGAGGNNTKEVVSFARRVQETGADGILSVTPYYNKTTQDGLIKHYAAICNAVALPVIVYNVPSRTGVNILPETLLHLSDIPNIVAIKEASGNVAEATEMLSLCGDRIDLYSGNDDISVPIYSVGGKGTISVLSNVMPAETEIMADAFFAGETEKAAELQRYLFRMIKVLFSSVNPIPVKYACKRMGLCGETVRLPLSELSAKEKRAIDECLEKYGIKT